MGKVDKKNIFQIWSELGERTPFAVRRENWGPDYYTVVVKIEIRNYPYGDAIGYTTVNGKFSDHYEYDKKWRESGVIPCGGCYQWNLVENADYSGCEQFLQYIQKKNSVDKKERKRFAVKIYEMSSILMFGKYKGKSIEEIFNIDPTYLGWCINNLNNFCLSDECLLSIKESTRFNFDQETLRKNTIKKS